MLRIGLVGCGTHAGWAVIPAIREASDRWTLAAAADINADNLAKIDDPTVKKYADHRAMIDAGGLDAIYIATLADTHAEIAIDAIEADLHVLCEKPMAATVAECERMVAAAEAYGKVIAIDFPLRYGWQYRQIRQWIDAGLLGRIEAFHEQHFWDAHKAFGGLAERRHRLCDKAGALDCGIHRADLARFFCGGEWMRVDALGRWFDESTTYPPHIGILAELGSGVMVTMNTSFSYTAYIEPKAYSDVMTIVGTDGVINCFHDREAIHSVQLVSASKQERLDTNAKKEGKAIPDLLRDFAKAIEGGAPAPEMATGRDGLAAQRFTEWANEAAVAARGGSISNS